MAAGHVIDERLSASKSFGILAAISARFVGSFGVTVTAPTGALGVLTVASIFSSANCVSRSFLISDARSSIALSRSML